MKKLNKIKKLIGIGIILLIIIIGGYGILIILPGKNKDIEIKETEKIKFGYVQYSRDTSVYKDVFKELKNELDKDSIDYKKYAEYISKLFIIDLYTLNNKNSKEDIGGMQYLKNELKDNFILNASNTMYKYVGREDIDLPIVSSAELTSINEGKYTINNVEYDSYEVNLKWEYKKDLGYDNEGKIIVIKDGEELYIVEKE